MASIAEASYERRPRGDISAVDLGKHLFRARYHTTFRIHIHQGAGKKRIRLQQTCGDHICVNPEAHSEISASAASLEQAYERARIEMQEEKAWVRWHAMVEQQSMLGLAISEECGDGGVEREGIRV
jgi:hypothetical protein